MTEFVDFVITQLLARSHASIFLGDPPARSTNPLDFREPGFGSYWRRIPWGA